MKAETMRERFYRITCELLDSDPRVTVVLADIGVSYLAARGAFERHAGRVINVGIREGLMVGVAGGMALEGLRPIVHSYAPFVVERTFEQVKLDLGHQEVGAILVSVGASYDWAEGGRTHHSPGDVALMATLPAWQVHVPGHADEVERLLRAAAATDERVYLRLSDASNTHAHIDGCGQIAVLREGSRGRPTILAVGPMLQPVLDAVDALDATILYTATARPIDGKALREHVTGPDLVLVEPCLEGTSAAAVIAALEQPVRLHAIGVRNIELRRYGSRLDHDRAHGLDAASLAERLRAISMPASEQARRLYTRLA